MKKIYSIPKLTTLIILIGRFRSLLCYKSWNVGTGDGIVGNGLGVNRIFDFLDKLNILQLAYFEYITYICMYRTYLLIFNYA